MDWPQLIIALVVIAAYVIKHIVSAQQEKQAAALREQVKAAAPDEVVRAESRPRPSLPMPVVVTAPVLRYEPPAPPRRDRAAQAEVRRIPRSEAPRIAPAKVQAAPKRDAPAVAAIPQIVFAPVMPTTSTASPAVRKALDLLRDRQTLAAAFVLREILDRPMALRRRRL